MHLLNCKTGQLVKNFKKNSNNLLIITQNKINNLVNLKHETGIIKKENKKRDQINLQVYWLSCIACFEK